jgi:hypothetical protein
LRKYPLNNKSRYGWQLNKQNNQPAKAGRYIVYYPDNLPGDRIAIAIFNKQTDTWRSSDLNNVGEISHWQNLPASPDEIINE